LLKYVKQNLGILNTDHKLRQEWTPTTK